jgi:ABC-2 type transport system ATP-binding protein
VFKGKKKGEEFYAVKEISLRIEPGIHGFLGPNGAGKTTTINMLIGALSISKGEAKIRGHKAGSLASNQLIGFLPQDPQFYGDMSGEDYLIYLGRLGGLSKEDARIRAQELLRYFDIWGEREREISKYSGGMKQKIGIASALIHKPKILILDEPTANLDPIGRQNIIDRIKDLSGEISVFVSSHILAEIEEMCEKVTMINHGEIIVSDTIKNIKKKYIGNTFILQTDKNNEIKAILEKDANIETVWIDQETDEHQLKVNPRDVEKFQRSIPHLMIDNDAILFSFRQPEVSLQDIFMTVMAKKEGS